MSIENPERTKPALYPQYMVVRDWICLFAVLIMPIIGAEGTNPFISFDSEKHQTVLGFSLYAGWQVFIQLILLIVVIIVNRETIYSIKWLPLGHINEYLQEAVTLKNKVLRSIIISFFSFCVEIVLALLLSILFRIIAGIAFAVLSNVLETLFKTKLDYDVGAVIKPDLLSQPGYFWAMMALAVIGGGLREEMWRGLFITIGNRLTNGRVWIPVVASSLYFGALHIPYGLSAFIPLTLLGFLFALIQVNMKSMRLAVYTHSIFNAFAIWLVFWIYKTFGLSPSQISDMQPDELMKLLEKVLK